MLGKSFLTSSDLIATVIVSTTVAASCIVVNLQDEQVANTVWLNPNAGPYCKDYSFRANHKIIVKNPVLSDANKLMLFLSGKMNNLETAHWKLSPVTYGQDKPIQLIQITARAKNSHIVSKLLATILTELKQYSFTYSDQCTLSFHLPHDEQWIVYGRLKSARASSAETGLSATLLTAPLCIIVLFFRRHILPSIHQSLRFHIDHLIHSIASAVTSIFK